MSESVRDQIIDGIVDLFRSTVVGDGGANYWFTPGLVKDVEGFSIACLDDSYANVDDDNKTTLYLLTPDEDEILEQTTGSIEAHMRLNLLLARQVDAVDHPLKDASTGSIRKIQNRLSRDAQKVINTNSDLRTVSLSSGGTVINFQVLRSEFASEEVGVAGSTWAVVLMRLQVHYEYMKDRP